MSKKGMRKALRRIQNDKLRYEKMLAEQKRLIEAEEYANSSRIAKGENRVIIFKSEMEYVSRCILDYPSIETGGQLFGFWTETGVPVVMYAIGPGPRANHQTTFFNQDVDYLVQTGGEIRRRFGLHHIGEWHSHHRLGLASPSGHDANTMISTIRAKGLRHFLLCIGNTDSISTTLNPFPCDDQAYYRGTWDVIFAPSPVRSIIDNELSTILVHPRTSRPKFSDESLNSVYATYPRGYWLENADNSRQLRDIITYLESNHPERVDRTSLKLDSAGLVHLLLNGRKADGKPLQWDIFFPERFPNDPPSMEMISDGCRCRREGAPWKYSGDIYLSLIKYISTTKI